MVNQLKVEIGDTADRLVSKLSEPSPKDLWELPPDPTLDARLSHDLTVLEHAARSAGPAAGPRREDPVRVVARRTTSLQAVRVAAPSGESVIVLNQGFLLFVYNFSRIVAAHLEFADDVDPVPPAPSPAEASRRVAELLDWSSSPLELPRIRTFPITSAQMRKASEFASVAQMFLVGHEYSHALLGHQQGGTQWLRVGDKEVPGLTVSQAQEFEADLLAMVLITRALRELGADLHPQNYAAIELLLHATSLVERFGGHSESATHPPAESRRQSLRAGLSTLMPEGHDVYVQNALAFEQMLNGWNPLILERARNRSAEVNARIDVLLAGTSAARQREELDSLLNEFPTATIARLRRELEQWNPDAVPTDDAARRLAVARSMIFLYVKLGTHPAVRQALVPIPGAFAGIDARVAASLQGVT